MALTELHNARFPSGEKKITFTWLTCSIDLRQENNYVCGVVELEYFISNYRMLSNHWRYFKCRWQYQWIIPQPWNYFLENHSHIHSTVMHSYPNASNGQAMQKKREGGKRLQFNFVRYIVQKKVSRGDVKIFLTHLASHIDKRPNSFTSTTDHYGSVAIFVFILTHSILHKNPELVNRRYPMSRQKELSRMWFEYVERCRFGKSSSGLLGIRKK